MSRNLAAKNLASNRYHQRVIQDKRALVMEEIDKEEIRVCSSMVERGIVYPITGVRFSSDSPDNVALADAVIAAV